MNSRSVLHFLALAALLFVAPLSALANDYGNRPIILTVHGLDFNKLACEDAIAINASYGLTYSREGACKLLGITIEAGTGGVANSSHSSDYLTNSLRHLCSDCDLRTFGWSGAMKESRSVIEQLKSSIVMLNTEAKSSGRQFVIVGHSWGGVLTTEALDEMDRDGTAKYYDLSIDQVTSIGSPIEGPLYSAAVNIVITNQNFYTKTFRPRSVKRWANYYADRDLISGPVSFADQNVKIDADVDLSGALDKIKDYMYAQTTAGNVDNVRTARADMAKLVRGPESTFYWHSAYMDSMSFYLPSTGGTLTVDLASRYFADYLNPPQLYFVNPDKSLNRNVKKK